MPSNQGTVHAHHVATLTPITSRKPLEELHLPCMQVVWFVMWATDRVGKAVVRREEKRHDSEWFGSRLAAVSCCHFASKLEDGKHLHSLE